MSSELRTRFFSGVVYAAIILLSLGTSKYSGLILLILLGTISCWEILTFLYPKNKKIVQFISVIFLVVQVLFSLYILESERAQVIFGMHTLGWIIPVFLIFWAVYIFSCSNFKASIINTFGSLLYLFIAMASSMLILIFEQGFSPIYLIAIFVLVWANDSFAYFAGKSFGRTPLAPNISPKKTIEGLLGGIVMTILTGFLIAQVFKGNSTSFWMSFAAIVSVTSPIGDLIESKIKRMVGKKDSGNIIPGHGGILDRIDGFIFSVPWIFVFLIKNSF